jgi:hypothetical protein
VAPRERILETVVVTTVKSVEVLVDLLMQVIFLEVVLVDHRVVQQEVVVHEDLVREVAEHKFREHTPQQVAQEEQEKYVIDFYELIKKGK